jgi:EAL domain-containing protein (putative c-di-GMP-specific phosphodiesterase class I)
VLDALDPSFDVGGVPVNVTASVGVALFPEHADDPALVLRHAEVAMHWAKGARGVVSVYRRCDDPFEPRRLSLISGLRHAIRHGELRLHFQPKVDLATRRVVGAEALVRWHHPQLGWLPPDTFIDLAEQTGQIHALTGWLLRECIAQYAAWQREGLPLALSLNLSARNLQSDQLIAEVTALIENSGLVRPRLVFEITESAILQDPTRARATLEHLAQLGIEVAVDDFGTGYSSLANLKVLPVHELKIDKSFVMHMAQDQNDAMIVRSTIDLAHNLGLRVTAEGVESEAVLQQLVALGCDMAQGYFVAPPMSGADLREWLAGSTWSI